MLSRLLLIPISYLTIDFLVAGFTVLGWWLLWRYRRGSANAAVAAVKRFAGRQWVGVLCAAAIPVLARVVLLPIVPQPEPIIHDEYGHLLVADTLLHGRLANPPHPFAEHFDSIYILQRPTYASVYPLGQGAILAVGQVLTGNPWVGHVLSLALMTGGVCWMLYAWLSPEWALAGGILTGLVYAISTNWANNYLGGPLTAFGGALIFGAAPRLFALRRARYAALLTAGWSVVWFTRPFESIVPAGAIAVIVVIVWLRMEPAMTFGGRVRRAMGLLWPMAAILALDAGVTLAHNWRVTGNPLLMPYVLAQRQDGVPQSLLGQPLARPPVGRFADIVAMYHWQREQRKKLNHPISFVLEIGRRLILGWSFFVNYYFSLPILVGVWLAFRRRVTAWMVAVAVIAFLYGCLYPAFLTRYYAAYLPVIVLLIVQGLRAIHGWRPAGVFLTLAFGVLASCSSLRSVERWLTAGTIQRVAPPRYAVERELTSAPGRHLVLVRYAPNHGFYDEWIYNGADIDSAKVVWAREISPAKDRALVRYFKSRSVWYVNADEKPLRAIPYSVPAPE